jgi:hypothetical protein
MNFPDLLSYTNKTVEFVYTQKEKIKKLSGYQSDRHFLPKYYSKSLVSFVNNISVKDIEDNLSPVAESLRDILGLKINDYSYSVNQSDGGSFDCGQFNLSMFYIPDENNLTEVTFNVNLTLKNIFTEKNDLIFQSIPYYFQYVKFDLNPEFSLKNFIEQYEEFFIDKENHVMSHYDLNATKFELDFERTGKKIVLGENEIKIFFSSRFSVYDFLNNYICIAK